MLFPFCANCEEIKDSFAALSSSARQTLLFLTCLPMIAVMLSLSCYSASRCANNNESNASSDSPLYSGAGWQSYFQLQKRQRQKLFTKGSGQRKIGHPWSVRDMTFGRSKSVTFIALSLGPFGTMRRWNWKANVACSFHLALSFTDTVPRTEIKSNL